MEEKKRLPRGKAPKNDKEGSRTRNEVVYPTRDEQEFQSLLDYRKTCKNMIENIDILPPELKSRNHALKNRLRDLDQNGTLRSTVVEWLIVRFFHPLEERRRRVKAIVSSSRRDFRRSISKPIPMI
jgi:hypothetical protein